MSVSILAEVHSDHFLSIKTWLFQRNKYKRLRLILFVSEDSLFWDTMCFWDFVEFKKPCSFLGTHRPQADFSMGTPGAAPNPVTRYHVSLGPYGFLCTIMLGGKHSNCLFLGRVDSEVDLSSLILIFQCWGLNSWSYARQSVPLLLEEAREMERMNHVWKDGRLCPFPFNWRGGSECSQSPHL